MCDSLFLKEYLEYRFAELRQEMARWSADYQAHYHADMAEHVQRACTLWEEAFARLEALESRLTPSPVEEAAEAVEEAEEALQDVVEEAEQVLEEVAEEAPPEEPSLAETVEEAVEQAEETVQTTVEEIEDAIRLAATDTEPQRHHFLTRKVF
ncbi:MAG: hypothetical protein QXI19_07305 [Candidatus Caldarchaeum sp.]